MSNNLTFKQDPAADWTSRNPVLAQFEIGYESDTGKAKLGDGVTAWNSLGYWNPAQGNVKVYRALLTQTGTNAPVATVLENTLGGTVAWKRDDPGIYNGGLVEAFTLDKTVLSPVNASASMEGVAVHIETSFYQISDSTVRLQTAVVDLTGPTITLTDALLSNAFVEILVYP